MPIVNVILPDLSADVCSIAFHSYIRILLYDGSGFLMTVNTFMLQVTDIDMELR